MWAVHADSMPRRNNAAIDRVTPSQSQLPGSSAAIEADRDWSFLPAGIYIMADTAKGPTDVNRSSVLNLQRHSHWFSGMDIVRQLTERSKRKECWTFCIPLKLHAAQRSAAAGLRSIKAKLTENCIYIFLSSAKRDGWRTWGGQVCLFSTPRLFFPIWPNAPTFCSDKRFPVPVDASSLKVLDY